MVCPVHRQPLMETAIATRTAGKSFYPAEERLSTQSQVCGVYSDRMMEKLALIASDSAWLLQNGMDCGSFEQTYAKYVQYARSRGFESLTGRLQIKKLLNAVQDNFGVELLVLLDASIENVGYSWIKRIFRSPQSFQYPVRHILLMELMAGSTRSFFREECPEFGSDTAKCYAVKSDFLTAENARFTTWKAKPSDYGSHPAMSGTEARTRYRRRWLELMEQRPDAIRSELIEMAPSCYAWLRKNDFEWYNSHSPPAKYGNFD